MHTSKWSMGTVVVLVVVIVLGPAVGPTQAQEPGRPEGQAGAEAKGGAAAVAVDALAGFDHDGFGDLAIGVPFEDLSTIVDAGGVSVLYGSDASGLTASGDQYWNQDGSGVLDSAETSDIFGSALAVGDFDGDDYADLAIGVPYQDVGGHLHAGAVHILYGSSSGLTSTGDQLWSQASSGIEGAAEDHDWFGQALAAGDFDGDGYDDLAIGAPGEDIGTLDSAGAVNIIYGSASGLSSSGDQLWHQSSDGIQGPAEAQDLFGFSLAAGDFDRDGCDDLAIGVVHEDVLAVVRAGAVNIIYGSAGGLTDVGNRWLHQDTSGILDTCETEDVFGWAVAAGDFDRDGYADLAIGVPGEDLSGMSAVGAVNVVYGSSGGLTGAGDQFWYQGSAGTQNAAEDGDRFGRALTAGDFDGDGHDDLAVGVPYEDNGSTQDTGAVHVFYGTGGGLSATNDWWFCQSTAGMSGAAEEYDHFGLALAAGDFNGDGCADLAIGVPYEDLGTIDAAGAVNVVYGSASGLTTTGNQLWHQAVSGVIGAAEDGDRFGYALAALPPERHYVYLPLVLRQ
jgi:hypothetical protein